MPGRFNDHRLRHTPQRILGNFLDLGRADAKAPHFGTKWGPFASQCQCCVCREVGVSV
ncbi:Uncharacterised protein [Mycobacterium tuberculosis]|nr:Uncharacterised protein [Mycobacterium tuberculosis]